MDRRRLIRGVLAAMLALPIAWVALRAAGMARQVAPFVADELALVPSNEVGLVLGCSPEVEGGRKNLFFVTRIRAASSLYRAGKVRRLLVSGDNSEPGYDEPSAMAEALMAAGVPREHITRDFAGFRTLDSVIRAKEVFGLERMTVISQRFHVERAIFLARAHGVDAVGFAAADVHGPVAFRLMAREIASRLVAVLDVSLFGTRPRILGPRVDITTAR
jgi:SanA protein